MFTDYATGLAIATGQPGGRIRNRPFSGCVAPWIVRFSPPGVTVVFAAPGGVVAVALVVVLATFGAARPGASPPADSSCCPAEEAGRASA
ncbi:MAG TPA: hypothetical protein VME44_13240 [Streptosporangiaceae bacterium]|nr:hypothetical protein [Streptosporangiaceae bacterium]